MREIHSLLLQTRGTAASSYKQPGQVREFFLPPGKRLHQTMERSPWSTIFDGKMMGKPWENGDLYGKITMIHHSYGKMMGKPWENGDLYGQIHHFEWEDSLFRLGHVQSQTVSLPEGTGKFRWQIHTVITGKIWQTSGLRFNKLGALKEASSASDSPPLGICSSGVAPSPKSTALVMSTEQRPEKLAETGWSFRGSSRFENIILSTNRKSDSDCLIQNLCQLRRWRSHCTYQV